MMFAPEHATAIAEVTLDSFRSLGHGLNYKEATADIKRTMFVRQGCRLFGRETVFSGCSVIFCVATGGLINQPFADIAFVSVGSLGQLGGSEWTSFDHCLIET